MCRSLAPFFILLLAVPGWADDSPVVVRTVLPDGKPVANAKVWVYQYPEPGKDQAEPKPGVSDATGKVSVPGLGSARRSPILFARDEAGQVGSAWLSHLSYDADPMLMLVTTAERTGRVTGPDGKPIAGATITPEAFYLEDDKLRQSGAMPSSIDLPPWERKRLAVKTDANGKFKLLAPSPGYSAVYTVEAEGHGKRKWFASVGAELETKLLTPGTVRVSVAGVEPASAKGAGVYLSPQQSETAKRTSGPVYDFRGTFDAGGKTSIEGVTPGKYTLTLQSAGTIPGLLEPGQPFEVVAGKTAEVTAKFGPAAKVSGKLTDADTGKGIGGMSIMVRVSNSPTEQSRQTLFVQTNADGTFTAHGPTGWYSYFASTPPDGYVLPFSTNNQSIWPDAVKVEVGKAHEFAAFPLIKAVSFAGRVVDANGKAVADATVSIADFGMSGRRSVPTASDKEGRFTLTGLAPDDAVSPRVRAGKAVNVPQTFELSAKGEPKPIEVSEANAAGLKGRITDAAGKPIAGAKVSLMHAIQGVGRYAQYGTYGRGATAVTDADGRYTFADLWPKDRYGVQVSASGYTDGEAKDLFGEAGKVKEFPAVKLTRANQTIHGVVVGAGGRTVPDAEVFQVDGPTRTTTKTAADGTFSLGGYPDTASFVFVRKAGFRFAAVPVFPSQPNRLVVKLMAADGPPLAAPEISAQHTTALNDLARHLFTQLWETRDTLNYGQTAIRGMAELNPVEAKKWRDAEKERTAGKTDYTAAIDAIGRQDRILELAKSDIDKAAALIVGLSANAGYSAATQASEKLLATDKPKALRLAEEAVVKARQLALPAKIYSLAQAGDLVTRAGGANGKAAIDEAVELAATLTPNENSRESMTIGMVAARLAPHDWPKAEAMLNTLKSPGDYNRFLMSTAARLATVDLDRSKKLLFQFKQDNSSYPRLARIKVAVAIAPQKPDAALELVNAITDVPDRVQGLVRLADVFAKTDKPRAVKTIDAAFDLMEKDAEAFRSWSNYSGRAGFAVVAVAHAKEIGHPDLTTLVARTLAMRGTGREESPERMNDQRVNFATALALVDPAAARHVLASVAPPDEFVTRALSNRRDWTFALALADPERAKTLVDMRIDQAKKAGANGLRGAGLSELGSILTAQDRLEQIGMWGSLPMRRDYE